MAVWQIGWKTAGQYGQAMTWAGLALMGIGLLRTRGQMVPTLRLEFPLIPSVVKRESWEWARKAVEAVFRLYGSLVVTLAAGGTSILLGWLIGRMSS